MREFFLDLLNNLDKMAGLKQLDKIYASHDDVNAAKAEIKKLLDVLCNVSSIFHMIPNEDQQKIITQAVITEDFPSLNGNVLYKWLSKHKDKFMKPVVEDEKPEAPPLTGEARLKALERWKQSLSKASESLIARPMDRQEIEIEGKEWASEIERKAVSVGYKKTDFEALQEHDLHIQYIKENYDPHTAKPLPTWVSEEEWRIKHNVK